MDDLVCLDLMNTIIYAPDERVVLEWLKPYGCLLSGLQRELFLIGFPFSPFVRTEQDFFALRDILLVYDTADLKEITCIAASRSGFTSDSIEIQRQMELVQEYIRFWHDHISIDTYFKRVLEKIICCFDVKLVSNLYSVYRSAIDEFKLRPYFKTVLLSCEIGVRKPENAVFSFIEDKNYNRKIFIGDDWMSDMLPALKRGYKCFYFARSNSFMELLLRGDLKRVVKRLPDDCLTFKNRYYDLARRCLDGILDIDHMRIPSDFCLQDGTLRLKALRNVECADSFRDLLERDYEF